ncbi:MAG: TonB-dependent receptor [Proteobacteria bacterium]|nr:TonB-dependent receptor [Pseudomonadota bacterium]
MDFNIPAQTLSSALKTFAEDTGLQMLYSSDTVKGIRSNSVNGKHQPKEALDILLGGTGLSFKFTDSNTVVVQKNEGRKGKKLIPQRDVGKREEAEEKKGVKRPVEIEQMVVTARGHATAVTQTPGGIGIIENDEIKDKQANSLTNLLNLIPGVCKSSDSAWGSAINIRGLGRDQVIFLVDGCRVNTATLINAQFGTIDPHEIERIEILKGPISSLYGSGSIGGVVNVITRSGRFSKKTEWDGGGSLSYYSISEGFNSLGFAAYNSSQFYAYLSQSYRDHDSYKDGDGHEMHNSQFRDRQTTFNLGYKVNESNKLELKTQYFVGKEIGIPGTGNAPLPKAADITYPATRRKLFNLAYTLSPEGFACKESKITVYNQSIDRRVRIDHFPASHPALLMTPNADHDTLGMKWQNIIKLTDHTVVAGLDIWQRELESHRERYLKSGVSIVDQPLPDSKFTSAGFFAEDDWRISEQFKLNIGGRLDSIEAKNDTTYKYIKPPAPAAPNPVIWPERSEKQASWNFHVGLTYVLDENWTMNLIGARGYRAASLEERYQYVDLGGGKTKWGDPDLNPEQSLFFEYGLHWKGEKAAWNFSIFHNSLEDLIAEKYMDATTIKKANINEAKIYGSEMDATWLFHPNWSIYGNIAYARGEDTKNNEDLPNIAPLNGMLDLRYENIAGIWGTLGLNWAARQDTVPSGVEKAPGWATIDMRLGYKFSVVESKHEMFIGVDNLLDKEYYDYLTTSRGYTFNEPGRSFVLGYSFEF